MSQEILLSQIEFVKISGYVTLNTPLYHVQVHLKGVGKKLWYSCDHHLEALHDVHHPLPTYPHVLLYLTGNGDGPIKVCDDIRTFVLIVMIQILSVDIVRILKSMLFKGEKEQIQEFEEIYGTVTQIK